MVSGTLEMEVLRLDLITGVVKHLDRGSNWNIIRKRKVEIQEQPMRILYNGNGLLSYEGA